MSITINEELTVRGMNDEGYGSITIDLDLYPESQYTLTSSLPHVDQVLSNTSADVFRYFGGVKLTHNQAFSIKTPEDATVDTRSDVFVVQKIFTKPGLKHLVAENLDRDILLVISENSRRNKHRIISEEHPSYESVKQCLYNTYTSDIPDLLIDHLAMEFPQLKRHSENVYIGTDPKSYLIADKWFYQNIEGFESEIISQFI